MFSVIEPKEHSYYRSRIALLRGMMELYFKIPLSYEEQSKATFIIAEKNAGDVYGGALLYKRYLFSSLNPPQGEIWEAIPFLLHEYPSVSLSENKFISIKIFYDQLFKKLFELGFKKRATLLSCTLSVHDYEWIRQVKSWNHDLVINSEPSVDGLFKGMFLRRPYLLLKEDFQTLNSPIPLKRLAI